MPRIYPLFSSSSGNCTYIGSKTEGILIDCGASYTRIKKALAACGIIMEEAVSAVFITHAHSDHISGLNTLSKKLGIPVFAQSITRSEIEDRGLISRRCDIISKEIVTPFCTVRAFETSHDTPQSCGYRIDLKDGSSCGVCTDLGYVSEEIYESLRGCNAVLVESNYDGNMLDNCDYPYDLKQRIRSGIGHLSNEDCGELCAGLIKNGTDKFILGHISPHSNTPEKALETNVRILSEHGFIHNRDYIMTAAHTENSCFTAF